MLTLDQKSSNQKKGTGIIDHPELLAKNKLAHPQPGRVKRDRSKSLSHNLSMCSEHNKDIVPIVSDHLVKMPSNLENRPKNSPNVPLELQATAERDL